MSHDRHDDEFEMTRREALLAAGAGGLSLMGFCNACMAAEDKMIFGATTPMKNISKLDANNPIIQQVEDAAAQFKDRNFEAPKLARENMISRVQEIFHKGEAARKLHTDRSVVRTTAAPVTESEHSRVLSHMRSEGFSPNDLKGAQVYFTRTSLLDHNSIKDVKNLPVSKLVTELPRVGNVNLNSLMAVSYDSDPKVKALNINTLLAPGRGALQMSFQNFIVPSDALGQLPKEWIDPPMLKVPNIAGRLRVIGKIVKLPGASSSSSGSSSSGSGSSGSGSGSSGSGSTELTAREKMQCFVDCVTQLSAQDLAALTFWCAPCVVAVGASAAADAATAGGAAPVTTPLSIGLCIACALFIVASFVTCYNLCTGE